ncbi:hypothetical protein A3B57_01005 [Microgenomates group bacterium RIFCSPLOWO2_01_FULL_47_10]|nr:MAG: hypothetical protein A3B57_01005 [Microgenomates group bacterium RIFCSPLOWO2_01_FULL_47_10]
MKLIRSLQLAQSGIRYAFATQPNMRFHGLVTLLVIVAAAGFKVSLLEWMVLLFTILLMLTAEMINTSLEAMTDLITREHRESAKVAKDVSAGMVLLNAVGSVIVGLVIFGPKIASLIFEN